MTPVVRNALRATVDRGHLSRGNRRAQSVDALDSPSATRSPPPDSPVNHSSSPLPDLSSVQFQIRVDKIIDNKGQVQSISTQNDAAYVRFEKDATVSIFPANSSHFEQHLVHLKPESLSLKKKRLRITTADFDIKVKHDDYRHVRLLYDRLNTLILPHKLIHKNLKPLSPRSGPKHGAKMLSSASVDETSSSPNNTSSGKPFKLTMLKNIKLWSNRDPKLRSPESHTSSKDFVEAEGAYGIPLHRCPMSGSVEGVPMIVELCCSVIENMGIRREGIYRVSGNAKNIELLESELSKNLESMDRNCDLWLRPNVVASVLKRYLLQLPDPLIPSVYYNEYISTQRLTNRNDRMLKLHRLLGVMEEHEDYPHHKCHHKTLQYLVNHLYKVTQNSGKNKMKLYNLAMVFAPSLFGQRDQESMMTDSVNLINLTKTIILYKDWLFTDWQTADLSLPPEVSEEEFDTPLESASFGNRAMSPEPVERDGDGMDYDKNEIARIIKDIINSATSKSARGPVQSDQWKKPVYKEVDIDAAINNRQEKVTVTQRPVSDTLVRPPLQTRLSSRTDSSCGGDSDLESTSDQLQKLRDSTEERLRLVVSERDNLHKETVSVRYELRATMSELLDPGSKRHACLLSSRSSDELSRPPSKQCSLRRSHSLKSDKRPDSQHQV